MKNYLIYCGLIIMALCSACTSEIQYNEDKDGEHVCRLWLDTQKPVYESGSTRSTVEEWKDGDCIYLSFLNGTERVTGRAVYTAGSDYWTLYYNGQLPQGTVSTCYAYSFDGDTYDNGNTVELSATTCVYADKDGTYRMTKDGMSVALHLTPQTGRIRFNGEKGKRFTLSGVCHSNVYNKQDGGVERNAEPIAVKVGDNGSTPYLYCAFETSDRVLSIFYDNMKFTKKCDRSILSAGLSGYMQLPTEDSHDGWTILHLSKPTLSPVSVAATGYTQATLCAAIDSKGNGTITDCGFCYSRYPSPSIAEMVVKCDAEQTDMTAALTGLVENTKYYVRAYAINETGINYSDEMSFTTMATTLPVLSTVAVTNIESATVHLAATVTDKGDDELKDAGFVYSSTNKEPTLQDAVIACNAPSCNLDTAITCFKPETTYYVRAYAVNSKGTAYSSTATFTTEADPTVWDGKSVATSFAGGIGSKDSPILIATAAQLKLFANNVNSGNTYKDVYFELVNNIKLNNYPWLPIGTETSWFSGNFNGAGHIISGINVNRKYGDEGPKAYYHHAVFFGYGYLATIRNLCVDGHISGDTSYDEQFRVGGVIGHVSNCIIENNINYCTLNMGGGILNYLDEYTIMANCVNYGNGAQGGLVKNYFQYMSRHANCNHSFWLYDTLNNKGNPTASPWSSNETIFQKCASFARSQNSCLIASNYTKDLVEELNEWVYFNNGEVHYNKWEYEILDGYARPRLIPE